MFWIKALKYGPKSQEINGTVSMAFRRLWRRMEKQRSTEQSQVAAINRKKYTVYQRNTTCVIQRAGFSSSVLRASWFVRYKYQI